MDRPGTKRMSRSPADPRAKRARQLLTRYLRDSELETKGWKTPSVSDPPLRRLGKAFVPPRMRSALRIWTTDVVAPMQRRRATRIGAHTPLRLHLGSAAHRKEGWINIDLVGDPVDLAWNLTNPLPFRDDSVEAIFSEHVLEHFSLAEGLSLISGCHRVLRPDGVLRVGVPDARKYATSYVQDPTGFLAAVRPERPTPLLAMQELFYLEGHRTMYDFETLRLVCEAAGFAEIEERSFGSSRLAPAPDSEHRRAETLYVECVK